MALAILTIPWLEKCSIWPLRSCVSFLFFKFGYNGFEGFHFGADFLRGSYGLLVLISISLLRLDLLDPFFGLLNLLVRILPAGSTVADLVDEIYEFIQLSLKARMLFLDLFHILVELFERIVDLLELLFEVGDLG